MSTSDKVKAIMDRVINSNTEEIDMEKIVPIDEQECKYGINGLWLFIGPQGSGKTYKLNWIILFSEHVHEKPIFNQILFSSTSDGMDKTLEMFKKEIRTPVEFIPESKLLDRLEMHIKRKKKFYSMMKYIKSNGRVSDEQMKKTAKKYRLYTPEKTAKYIKHKVDNYGHPKYPAHTLLILDDYLGSDALERRNDPLVKMLTKLRHYNITTVISQQSCKGIGKTARLLSSDVCIWKGFGEEDFLNLFAEQSLPMNKKELFQVYKSFQNRHDCLEVHKHLDEVDVEMH